MSGPIGRSFNDNVDDKKLERLHMGTAKQFSQLLLKSGRGAKFSKFDILYRTLISSYQQKKKMTDFRDSLG